MKKVCAGIVTHNPDREFFLKCYEALRGQVNAIYIVDNGSKDTSITQSLETENPSVHVYYNGENEGIAKALNQLCSYAEKDGYDWIMTMDQDSICSVNMVGSLVAYADNGRNGIIAPRVEFKAGDQLIASTKDENIPVVKVRACITSGSLTRIEAWRKVGGFDEWLFIDHVDNEFCTHLIKEDYDILRVNKAILYQRAGEMKYINLPCGRKLMLPCYSEFRNYHICRNTVYYIKKYKKDINHRHELSTLIYSLVIKIFLEPGRLKTIRSAIKGIKDGCSKEIEFHDYCSARLYI